MSYFGFLTITILNSTISICNYIPFTIMDNSIVTYFVPRCYRNIWITKHLCFTVAYMNLTWKPTSSQIPLHFFSLNEIFISSFLWWISIEILYFNTFLPHRTNVNFKRLYFQVCKTFSLLKFLNFRETYYSLLVKINQNLQIPIF